MPFLLPPDESLRIQALIELSILDTPPDAGIDAAISLVRRLLDVPIALVSLVDEDRQWFKGKSGLDICETDREHAFCAHTILSDDVMVVEDATQDARFWDNPFVVGAPHIRAYAGAPITLRPGIRIGTVCIIDTKPRRFSTDEIETLTDFAKLVVGRIKLLKLAQQAEERAHLISEANRLAERAQVVLGVMSDGVVVQDRTGAIVSANESACTILGLTIEQLMGRTSIDPRWRSVNEDGSELLGVDHPAMRTLATGMPVNHVTLGIEQPDHVRRWLRVSTRPLFEDDTTSPSHAVATFSDITEIVDKSKALQNAQETADAANYAKSAFLANISHEIRTPLNAVIGLTSVLSQSSLNATQAEMVELIKSSGETLERLLSDILDFSKIEAGKLELCLAPMDLQATVSAAAQLIGLRADDKGIGFSVIFGAGTDGQFLGDAIRLRQIVSNLASNALKFTERGKVTVQVDIDNSYQAGLTDPIIKIVVSDTGRGFDAETATRLFSRFEQADKSITRAFGGTGLGLAICKSLTELMGGTISATSTPDVGSTFNVTFPTKKLETTLPDPKQVAACDNQRTFDNSKVQQLRVLMAEDHPINQRVTSLCLAPFDAQIIIAENGLEAVHAFQTAQFDIVLMDMQMPQMDGLEATRLIRKFEAENNLTRTPISMLSANAMQEHIDAALEAGCDNHIAKPRTPASLCEGIEEAMQLCQQWSDNNSSWNQLRQSAQS